MLDVPHDKPRTSIKVGDGPFVEVDLDKITRRLGMSEVATQREDAANFAEERLRSVVERVERLEEERKSLGSDIKDIFAEAKSAGFDVKVLRQIIRIRKIDPAEYENALHLLDTYRLALGMVV